MADGNGDDTACAGGRGNVPRREGMTMEVAAKQLGVSVKSVSRWVGVAGASARRATTAVPFAMQRECSRNE